MKVFILNLFYLRFCFGPDVLTGNFSVKMCGVAPWRCSVRNIISLHTHTILPQNFTNNVFFSFFSFASPFQVYLSRGGIESLYIILSLSVKGRVSKTEIFYHLSKNS